ncbi:MAG: hypothetical protein N2038_02740 [Geminicoccaceae bacterium]|nr:hypothetical protein [Geminicoccaceae bacterium]
MGAVRLALLGLLAVALSAAFSAPRAQLAVDRLHGLVYPERTDWAARVLDDGYLWTDRRRFVLLRVSPASEGGLEGALRAWARERTGSGGAARVFWRPLASGALVRASGLGVPARLADRASFEAYEEFALVLPDPGGTLVLSLFVPQPSSRNELRALLDFVREIRFLEPQERVPFRREVFYDLETGAVAGTVHVPQEATLRGGIVRQGDKRLPVLEIRTPELRTRIDAVDVAVYALQSPFGVQAQTTLIVNGQAYGWPGFVAVDSPRAFATFLCELWKSETGRGWSVDGLRDVPGSGPELPAPPLPPGASGSPVRFDLVAHSGSLRRQAFVGGFMVRGGQARPWTSDASLFVNVSVFLTEAERANWDRATSIVRGIANSFRLDPAAALSALERWNRDQRRTNEWLREWLAERREERSRNSTAWSNLLSDQTYLRDPSTGEIARVPKPSWAEGSFWREPVFGDAVLGAVREGSALEQFLREQGWRRLEESIEGFR